MKAAKPLLAAGAGLVLLAGLAAAVARPIRSEDRRIAVSDWLIEDVSEEEADFRTVRMVRIVGERRIEYNSYYASNGAHWRDNLVLGGGCSKSGWGTHTAPFEALERETREKLAASLAACGLDAGAVETALEGFERAFRTMWRWDEDAAAWAAASEAAMALEPDGPNATTALEDYDPNMVSEVFEDEVMVNDLDPVANALGSPERR